MIYIEVICQLLYYNYLIYNNILSFNYLKGERG